MQREGLRGKFAVFVVATGLLARAQAPAPIPPDSTPASSSHGSATLTPSSPATSGGILHGIIKSGSIALPGVTITAQNTLTGKKYTAVSDINGGWSLVIPQNGRYVVRTQFAAFAQGAQEVLLNATNHDQAVNFSLMLVSRVAQQEQQQNAQSAQITQTIRQLAGNGAQSLNLMNALNADTDTGAGAAGPNGAALPLAAGNSSFSDESVAISGQAGAVSPLVGLDLDRIRDTIEDYRALNGGREGPGGQMGGNGMPMGGGPGGPRAGPAGGGDLGSGEGFGGGGGGMMTLAGPGGGGVFFGGPGGFDSRSMMRALKKFNPAQPHGAIFWMGSNSALNAEPFSLRGQPQHQPPSGSNRFGLTLISSPYLPGVTKPSGKDTVFLTVSGQRSSSPVDDYATVPTDAERAGNFSAPGSPTIYDPTTLQQFSSNGTANMIPPDRIAPQATALLKYFPEPNLPGPIQNYHLLSTQQTNTTQAGIRYMRGIGSNASPFGGFGASRGRGTKSQGLRQSINFNFNWAHAAADKVNVFPELGGKTSSHQYSVQAGYVVSRNKWTSIANVSWNRSNSQAMNFFTNVSDVATQVGILGPNGTALNTSALNYGLPDVQLADLAGLSEQQPSFSVAQTISVSEVLSTIHGKHNIRFGGDYRRAHRDFLSGSNATGSFIFSGLFTEDAAGHLNTGSSLADFLLALPQETSIDSAVQKSYLRDNVFEAFAQDDWRTLPNLTLLYGLRYEYFAPYTEKYGRLAEVDTNPSGGFTGASEMQSGTTGTFNGKLPASLVDPYHAAFAPRVGMAYRLPKQTVLRAGFGMNYTQGLYATFATTMAHEPPFANEQTNQEATSNGLPTSACARSPVASCLTLANGFPAPNPVGNYALDPHYKLPYVEVWNVDVQKPLPWGIVMNLGYNGAKGNHLDITSAPRATPRSPNTNPGNLIFTYDQPAAFSKFSAATVRANKRMSHGIAIGANYQYSHLIDDANSEGSSAGVGAQDWQNLNAEEGNGSLDVRHKVSGTYLYELPFGQDKTWVTAGTAAHILEGLSVSGSFTFATGTPLSPYYAAQVTSVGCGTGGTFRPNLNPGVSVTAGGGSASQWFNPKAFSEPAANAQYPCGVFGNAPRNSIAGPGTVSNNMALSKTMNLSETRSMEIRATLNNAFNTVQYSGVDTNGASPTFARVISTGSMRSFQFSARFRF